ncbi:uncharacterized protein K460DRAFT_432834 [Cucurbitaria berberidis CBS 394.84]|uniref:Uncharacterized protein n=1 Tax=Cucurbitaria berberidis CBS 394.84 TaxID=1168544 RepID=A0A9P4GD84_9PLEO|nr:uncharacterized protein K460DRAFT_432834 [Cucurbitaria berberidis CBS 394.84]KAF1843252.1 hypothetical protein K460DRAFT_432834 [Cucurbitaria berberidis CBS 394.84]
MARTKPNTARDASGRAAPKAKTTPRAAVKKVNARARAKAREPTPTKYPIRRFLAQRTARDGTVQYLVDWQPGWESQDNLEGAHVQAKDWEEVKQEKQTIQFNGATVMKCTNQTEDNSPENVKLMVLTVVNKFKKYMAKDAATLARELFRDDDWVFGSTRHDEDAATLATQQRDSKPSAAEVLRRTYLEMRALGQHEFVQADLHYGAIKVRYIGQVDTSIKSNRDRLMKTRSASTVLQYLFPLFDRELSTMSPSTWKNETTHKYAVPISRAVERFATHTPYLLTQIWPLFLTRLFFTSDNLTKLFKKVAIELRDEWADATRDILMNTYHAECDWEMRPMDCVERTYLQARDDMQSWVKNRYDRGGYLVREGAERDGESDRDVEMEEVDE